MKIGTGLVGQRRHVVLQMTQFGRRFPRRCAARRLGSSSRQRYPVTLRPAVCRRLGGGEGDPCRLELHGYRELDQSQRRRDRKTSVSCLVSPFHPPLWDTETCFLRISSSVSTGTLTGCTRFIHSNSSSGKRYPFRARTALLLLKYSNIGAYIFCIA